MTVGQVISIYNLCKYRARGILLLTPLDIQLISYSICFVLKAAGVNTYAKKHTNL